ncbi:MAG TPA: chemotaxis protein CheW [Sphingobium sp.]
MADAAPISPPLLAFHAGGRRFGISAGQVREVTRIPRLTVVPQAPASLLGIANVRNEAVAVVSVASLLGLTEGAPKRMILIGGDHPAALAVDRVEGVVADATGCERPAFTELLDAAFPAHISKAGRSWNSEQSQRTKEVERLALLPFAIGNQLFALPLDQVAAVLRVPTEIARFPHADAATLGTIDWRGAVVPLLSLATLLDLPGSAGKTARIAMVRTGNRHIGLLVDHVHALLNPAINTVDPVPAALLRGGGEAVIQAIHRPEAGRLISILGADQLLRGNIATGFATAPIAPVRTEVGTDEEALLLVQYAGHRFAFPLGVIHQVRRAPTQISKVPHAPPFLPGLTSHRDVAVPVIDLSAHLSAHLPDRPVSGAAARMVIVSLAGGEAGLLVDGVEGIVRVPRGRLETLPALGTDRTAPFQRGVTLAEGDAFTLVPSPDALFSQVEADFIAGIACGSARPQ